MSDLGDLNRDHIRANAIASVLRTKKTVAFGAAAKAALATALTGANNDLDYTAEHSGKAGNDISIKYADPGAASAALAVVVTGKDIVVNLATGAGTNEIQLVTLIASGGYFTLAFRDKTTDRLAYNISAANLKAALEGLTTIGVGNVDVTLSTGVYTITFKGALAATNVPALVSNPSGLQPYKPKVEIVTTVPGAASPATDEIQKVRVQNAFVGTFTLTYSGQTTSALAYNATANQVRDALRALSNIGDSDLTVTKSGSEYTVTFNGTLAATNVAQLTANISGLRPSAVVTTDTPGVAYAITSTAADIATAIAASSAADALVDVANHAANDGTGVVTAMAKTNLAGGAQGYGSRATLATGSTALTGANNDLDYTAVPTGVDGNGITIIYVDPGGVTATLGVVVDSEDRVITVNLGRAASAINSTAAQVKTAIDALPAAAALVTVANKAANDGTGVVTAMSALQLAGGGEGGRIDLFQITGGGALASVVAVSTETPVGSGATFKVRSTDTADSLIGTAVTAESLAAGRVADFGGIVAAGTAPKTDPATIVTDGEKIYASISTADITDGTITFYCYYKKMDDGTTVRPL